MTKTVTSVPVGDAVLGVPTQRYVPQGVAEDGDPYGNELIGRSVKIFMTNTVNMSARGEFYVIN